MVNLLWPSASGDDDDDDGADDDDDDGGSMAIVYQQNQCSGKPFFCAYTPAQLYTHPYTHKNMHIHAHTRSHATFPAYCCCWLRYSERANLRVQKDASEDSPKGQRPPEGPRVKQTCLHLLRRLGGQRRPPACHAAAQEAQCSRPGR